MRSLTFAVVAISLTVLLFATWLTSLVSQAMTERYLAPVFAATDQLELEDAISHFETGGPAVLKPYMARLDRLFGPAHHLLDAKGRDLVTGDDFSRYLPSTVRQSRGFSGQEFVVTRQSSNAAYWFLSLSPRRDGPGSEILYQAVLAIVVLALCWLTAVGVIAPIRRLSATLQRFGSGDLGARAGYRRKDEIGELARSFDAMADRIEALLFSKKRLMEDISHELRSPLARLKMAVSLARSSRDLDTALPRIERDIDRLSALTAEIVTFHCLEGDAKDERPEQIDLAGFCAQAITDIKAEAPAADFSFTCPPGAAIMGYPVPLQRALENVLRNAARYAPPCTSVVLDATLKDGWAILSVRDCGPGIAEKDLPKLFDPFFRSDPSRSTATGGLGLGLSIAERAVAVHGGRITAKNAEPGLLVSMILPCSAQGTRTFSGGPK